ncbi:MAG TPA: M20/M25/M40 family metallo-hydrolase [Acidobacteriota bacterium]|nr:M20/M25/M40 family metallo-hydrolase [Acidobacteriota bacterium]
MRVMHDGDEVAAAQASLERRLRERVRACREELVKTIGELVSIPSENTPPVGSESECQRYVHRQMEMLGLTTRSYSLHAVADLARHSLYRHGRDYTDRPNVAAVWRGSGGGKSLLLSGHIDTVPRGSERWSRDPFAATVEGSRLYGLGSNDMKGGIAAMLLALKILKELGIQLRGDLLAETVVDEEFGGVNGTLAGRLMGHNADAAILCEPSQNMICPAQTGGRTAQITLRSAKGGVLSEDAEQAPLASQVHYFLGKIGEFAGRRRQHAPIHELYLHSADPVPAWVTKIYSGGWGTKEPITLPDCCRIELYWQTMPGETKDQIDREFDLWLNDVVSGRPDLFTQKPDVRFEIQWLPASAIDSRHHLVKSLAETFQRVTGTQPQVRGIGGPCDMFVFHQYFNVPAVLFGPRGGNTHAPDEWVDLESALVTVETLVQFICQWCQVDWEKSSAALRP